MKNRKRIWKRRWIKFYRALFVVRCAVEISVLLYAGLRALFWLFTSPWHEVRATLVLGMILVMLLVPISFIISRIERLRWPLFTLLVAMMVTLLVATIVIIFAALALGFH